MTSGRRVGVDGGPHQLDGALARVDVDAGAAVGVPRAARLGAAWPQVMPGRRRRSSAPIAAGLALGHRLAVRILEDELVAGRVVRHRHRIAPVEAGEAEAVVRQIQRREDAADREVAQRVGADELADLLDRMGRRDQLGLDLGVDAVEAGVVDRRRADPEVDLGRAGLAQQGHDLAGGGAAHDRIVDDDQPLAGHDLAQRAQLDGDAALAHPLATAG